MLMNGTCLYCHKKSEDRILKIRVFAPVEIPKYGVPGKCIEEFYLYMCKDCYEKQIRPRFEKIKEERK